MADGKESEPKPQQPESSEVNEHPSFYLQIVGLYLQITHLFQVLSNGFVQVPSSQPDESVGEELERPESSMETEESLEEGDVGATMVGIQLEAIIIEKAVTLESLNELATAQFTTQLVSGESVVLQMEADNNNDVITADPKSEPLEAGREEDTEEKRDNVDDMNVTAACRKLSETEEQQQLQQPSELSVSSVPRDESSPSDSSHIRDVDEDRKVGDEDASLSFLRAAVEDMVFDPPAAHQIYTPDVMFNGLTTSSLLPDAECIEPVASDSFPATEGNDKLINCSFK